MKHTGRLFVMAASILSCVSIAGMKRTVGKTESRLEQLQISDETEKNKKSKSLDIWQAAVFGDLERIKEIVEKDPKIVNAKDKEDGQTPLHWVATQGHCEIVKYLIEKGADVNAKDEYCWTPLHWATQEKQLEAVKAICKSLLHDLNPQPQKFLELLSRKDTQKKTALDMAKKSNSKEIVAYLVQIAEKAKTFKNPLLNALENEQKIDTTFVGSENLW